MYFVGSSLILNFVCWKWGNWREWKKYYSTILFFIIGNETCDLILYQKPLWEFSDIIGKYMFTLIGLMLLLYPCTVILYFTFFPKKLPQQILYVLLWASIYVLIEAVSVYFNTFTYHHGWNLLYTLVHNIIMFILLAVHLKKPLLAWPMTFVLALGIMLLFHVPAALVR